MQECYATNKFWILLLYSFVKIFFDVRWKRMRIFSFVLKFYFESIVSLNCILIIEIYICLIDIYYIIDIIIKIKRYMHVFIVWSMVASHSQLILGKWYSMTNFMYIVWYWICSVTLSSSSVDLHPSICTWLWSGMCCFVVFLI